MIRAVVFDYGNVISSFENDIFFKIIVKSSSKSLREIRSFVHSAQDLMRRYELGLMSSEDLFDSARDACGIKLSCAQFFEAWGNIFTPIVENRDLIRRLKPRYKLGLISNTCECHFIHEIEKADVYPLFDAISVSFRVHAMKPDVKIYEHQLSVLKIPSNECVYIDDVPMFVEAAQKLGFHALCFTEYNTLARDLKSLGVEA